MSLYCSVGSVDTDLSPQQLKELLVESLARLGARNNVLAVPPDQSREHSRAGELTRYAWEHYGDKLKAVLPALGTHTPMRPGQIAHMFGNMPQDLFRAHNWRTEIETLGELPVSFIEEQSEGKLSYTWPAQVNKLISRGGFDLILSIGQVVPHEVIGMANHSKNILVGTGGREGINRSHYLGAVYGMERIMGRADESGAQRAEPRLPMSFCARCQSSMCKRWWAAPRTAAWRCAVFTSATISSAS